MKIGIIRETKTPEDNRVPLTPKQIVKFQKAYPKIDFIIQSSPTRAYSDKEYKEKGILVKDDVSDSDILFGVKEAAIETLIPNKHYFFFGHIAKKQPYNLPLIQKMMDSKITFSDYEYLVDEKGKRLTAFGWWAGVVGAYNTLRALGIKNKLFNLPKPDKGFTLDWLLSIIHQIGRLKCKIVVTGNGRVSHGAQYVLNKSGFERVSNEDFLEKEYPHQVYTVARINSLVEKNENSKKAFTQSDFFHHPEEFHSVFFKYAQVADALISCHFWKNTDPVYLSIEELQREDMKISVIGDVTCDILGSIKSTLRASTHDKP